MHDSRASSAAPQEVRFAHVSDTAHVEDVVDYDTTYPGRAK
jgi:hypothetical protein